MGIRMGERGNRDKERESKSKSSRMFKCTRTHMYVCLLYKHLHRRIFVLDSLSSSRWTNEVSSSGSHSCMIYTRTSCSVGRKKAHTNTPPCHLSVCFAQFHAQLRSLSPSVPLPSRIHSSSYLLYVAFDTKWAFTYDNESWHLMRRSTLFSVFNFFCLFRFAPCQQLLQSAEFHWGLDHNIIIVFSRSSASPLAPSTIRFRWFAWITIIIIAITMRLYF